MIAIPEREGGRQGLFAKLIRRLANRHRQKIVDIPFPRHVIPVKPVLAKAGDGNQDVVPTKVGNHQKDWVPVLTGNPGFLLPCLPAGRRRNDKKRTALKEPRLPGEVPDEA